MRSAPIAAGAVLAVAGTCGCVGGAIDKANAAAKDRLADVPVVVDKAVSAAFDALDRKLEEKSKDADLWIKGLTAAVMAVGAFTGGKTLNRVRKDRKAKKAAAAPKPA